MDKNQKNVNKRNLIPANSIDRLTSNIVSLRPAADKLRNKKTEEVIVKKMRELDW